MLAWYDLGILLAGIALCYVVRLPFHALLPRRLEQGRPAGDLSGVLTKIEDMRGRRWPGYDVPDGVQPGVFAYPMLFHWLVSRWHPRAWRRVSVTLNILPDALAGVAAYLALLYLVDPAVGGSFAYAEPRLAALLAMALVYTMPILLPANSRMMTTNGRAAGVLLAQGTLLALYVAAVDGSYLAASAGAGLATLTVLTSLFGTQIVVFLALPLAVLTQSVMPIAVVALALGILWAVPALGGREILRFKYHHFRWYRRNADKIFAESNARSLLHCFVLFVREIRSGRRGAFSRLRRRSPLVITVYSMPALVLLAVAASDPTVLRAGLADPLLRFCLVLTLCAAVVFVLTSTRWLVEWGQAERYWEPVVPAVTVVTAALSLPRFGAAPLLGLLLFQVAVVVLLHVYRPLSVWRFARAFPGEESELEVLGYLDRCEPRGGVVLTLPQQLQRFWARYTRRLEGLPYRFVFTGVLPPAGSGADGFAYIDRIFADNHQYPSLSPEQMRRELGVTHVIAQNAFVGERSGRVRFVDELLARAAVGFRNDKYTVYLVPDGA